MSIVEIIDIKLHKQPASVLLGFVLDAPVVGTRHPAEAVDLRGWVIGGESAVEAIEIAAGAEASWQATTGLWRDDIARDFPAVPNAERSGFQARLDLTGLPPVFELAILAVTADGRRPLIGRIRGRRFVEEGLARPLGSRQPASASPLTASTPASTKEVASSQPRAAVVIPVHNRADLTGGCLDALFGSGGATVPFDVIVVDDGSSDSTPELVAGFGDRVRMVRLDPNAGFAAARNAGAAVSRADRVVFLDNGTIPQPGWLDALVAHADAFPEAAIVGAKLLYPNGSVQSAGVSFTPDGSPHHLYAGFPASHPAVNRTRPFQAVTAACCLVRAGVFRAVGGFDRALGNGWEDVDLCLRVGEAGHQVHYCPDSVVLHQESATGDGASPGEIEDRRRWTERWLGRVRGDCLDFWVADGLLAVELLGPRYPVRVRLAPELAVRGLEPRFVPVDAGDRRNDGDRAGPVRNGHRRFRPIAGSTRTARRASTRPRHPA